MVCLEDLALLGHQADHRFERGILNALPKVPASMSLDHLPPGRGDQAEVLQPFFPKEPGVVGTAQRIGFPVTDKGGFKRDGTMGLR